MKKLTAEWIGKAEEDYSVASGLARRRKTPANSICFHCQQAAEKYLKAVLQERQIPFGKTHDLEGLLGQCVSREPELSPLTADMQLLNDYSVAYRYPGCDATRRQARQAMQAARATRKAVLALLKAP